MFNTLLYFVAFFTTAPTLIKFENTRTYPPIVYSSPPPPPPPPIYIWINGYSRRWNEEPNEDYDGDSS
jgi:hypothetical protein